MHDFLTDLVCVHAAFDSALGPGIAHAGMLKAAQRLLPALAPTIDAGLAANHGYALVFTGHSLGAAIAALMALLVGPHWTVGGGCPQGGDRCYSRQSRTWGTLCRRHVSRGQSSSAQHNQQSVGATAQGRARIAGRKYAVHGVRQCGVGFRRPPKSMGVWPLRPDCVTIATFFQIF